MNLSLTITFALLAGATSGSPKVTAKGTKVRSYIDVGTIRPESCVPGDGPEVYVGEIFYGGVKKVNLLNGKITTVVPSYGFFERSSFGLLPVDEYLFVAGGGTPLGLEPKFYVYNIKTGKEVVACSSPYSTPSLLNDVAVLGRKAYFTDSQTNALVVADIEAAKKGQCVLSSIPLPADQFLDPNYKIFLANGIVAFGRGLVISNEGNGGLYFVDPKSQNVKQIASATDAPTTDGLRLAGNLLYAAENLNNRIAVWKLSSGKGGVTAVRQGYLNSSLYDSPTGLAIYEKWIFACNARFATLGLTAPGEAISNFTEHFSLVGVDRFGYSM